MLKNAGVKELHQNGVLGSAMRGASHFASMARSSRHVTIDGHAQ